MDKPRILVVDDDRVTRQLLGRMLSRDGFEVSDSADGREALQLVEAEKPDLVVSDYEMPEFTGAQLCELIRQHKDPELANLPIILLTAHAGEEHEVECLKAGANDFVTKPVNGAILKARIDTHLRLHHLQAQLRHQNAELGKWRQSREMDLEAAQLTQQAILPAKLPAIGGWDIASYYQPVIQVGGDMYDWRRLSDGGWLFWMADATGHGASAALLTTLTKLVFHHAAGEMSIAPCSILTAANRDFFSILKGKSFMTAACLVIHPNLGRLCYAGAGHPPLLIQRKSGEVVALPSQGPPVGILGHQECGEICVDLQPGDTALLYTDGLYSFVAPDGTRYSPKHLEEIIPRESVSAEDFLNETVNEVSRRNGGAPLPDDVAVIALRRV